MDIEKILEAQKILDEEVKKLLIDYRDGKIEKVISYNKDVLLSCSYRHLRDLMKEVGFKTLDDTDFNGWERDYWETYSYNGELHTLYGTMADGSFELYPKED